MSDLKSVLQAEFADKEYAHAYMHAHLLERLAAQLYACRTARGLSQIDLAELSGIPQGKLSKLESAEVNSFTLSTLTKLADALDVSLNVGFEPFTALARRVAERPSDVPSRVEDLKCLSWVNRLVVPTVVPGTATTAAEQPAVKVLRTVPRTMTAHE